MKAYNCTYTAYNRDFKEYKGAITVTGENIEQAYDKAHKTVRDTMGSDLTVMLSIQKDGEAE